MAPSFGRSISFPLSPARSSSKPRAASARHVRSISLPSCRAHPLLTHLQTTIHAARTWTAAAAEPTTSPSSGLAHLDALHAALAELLLLPEARAALLHSATADCLLDGFLVLADAHGTFQEALLDLKRHAADVQAALRRRRLDHQATTTRLAAAVRAQRHADKDLARLASSVRAAAKFPAQLVAGSSGASVAEIEVAGVLAEAVAAIASASAAVFSAVESVSSAATTAVIASSSKKPAATTLISQLVTRSSKTAVSSGEDKEMAALDRLEHLDECIAKMETGSDRVFRSILQTRVALLNIHTHTCC
ncbi:hypothetical protein HU200_049204 [Digitaria exilis]|uniref:Uncharacterized protein n=1 Tax=Digitaria exilis TaxID=1010633 RepID=A0A835EBE9_9POAL|nr:hypothetical protein HU200_049204 [Digitaria exilis]CAB3469070.1 unnamed protein product [Digitaria exilis]